MIQFTSIVLNADRSWTFTWPDSGSSFYRIILLGEEIANQEETTYTYRSQNFQTTPPPLEVVAESAQALSERFLPFMLFQWYGEDCSYYLVQQYQSGSWVTVRRLQENGSWVYTYTSAILPDGSFQQFRVIAVSVVGDQSTPRIFTETIVRPPASPDTTTTVGYNSGTTSIVVSG